jgi:S1-C subfamily serine protease
MSYNKIETEITQIREDTQGKFNELTISLISTNKELEELGSQVGSIDEKFEFLKSSTSTDFSGIISEVVVSVVTVMTDISQGTGFLITEDGYIVTNYHVIKNAKSAGVYTYDGISHKVEYIGHNENLDIALLKIEGKYEKLELGDSNKVQIGEKVIAIGNPLGLQFSVSEGIISGIHREGPNKIPAYIQTDAALNPGNSGGPLINKQGKVIGINNFKIGGGESLGFALESNYIKNLVNEIAQKELNQTLV